MDLTGVRHLSAGALAGALLALAPSAEAQVASAPETAPPSTDSGGANPIYVNGALDQFELRLGDGDAFRWQGEVWGGPMRHRLRLRSEGLVDREGDVENGQLELFYDRSISTYFSLLVGARYDLDSRPGRGWAAFGVRGGARYFFNVAATAYASDGGHLAAKLNGYYDKLLTQRLILQPQAEANLYSEDDPARLIGAGLSDLDAGLRLRYEFTERFAPYVGVTYSRKFGDTEEFARVNGADVDEVRVAIGVRTWF